MSLEFVAFDFFVDDLISSDENLLKAELDILLFQHLFDSLDLSLLKDLESPEDFDLAA